jgi:hypothetical protein
MREQVGIARQELERAQQQLGEVDHALAIALRVVIGVERDHPARELVAGFDGIRAQSRFLAVVDELLELRGGNFSSSMPCAFARRLMSDCWSPESMIWKSCGRFASRKCARSRRLHRPWNVPTHMPRVLIGSIAESRVSISRAALLVKVTARMPPGSLAGLHQVRDARREHARLAAACAREDQRALARERDGLELLGIEAGKEIGHAVTTKTAIFLRFRPRLKRKRKKSKKQGAPCALNYPCHVLA